MKKNLLLVLFLFLVASLYSQTFSEYQQKVAECFSKQNYKCAEENILATISIVDDEFSNLYLQYTNLGTAQRRQDKLEEALQSYNKAYALNDHSAAVLSNRASLKRKMKDYEGSHEDYTSALELDPLNDDLFASRSNTSMQMGDTISAEKDLLAAVHFNPKNYKALTNLTNIRVYRGEYDLALETYDELLSEHQFDPILFNNRADVFLKMKDYENAMLDVNKAIELKKSYGNAYVTRAEIHMALGDYKKALKELQKATKLGENSSYLFDLVDECNAHI